MEREKTLAGAKSVEDEDSKELRKSASCWNKKWEEAQSLM